MPVNYGHVSGDHALCEFWSRLLGRPHSMYVNVGHVSEVHVVCICECCSSF